MVAISCNVLVLRDFFKLFLTFQIVSKKRLIFLQDYDRNKLMQIENGNNLS